MARLGKINGFSLVLILTLALLTTTSFAREQGDKFLVIHLDSISSQLLFSELEAGNLPSIAEIFSEGQMARHGVTLFPCQTPVIIPRVRFGIDNSEGNAGWGYIDSETGRKKSTIPIFAEMFFSVPTISKHQFLLGFEPTYCLAGLSLHNLKRLWQTHDVLEMYWFHTDDRGHFLGTEGHRSALHAFDRFLGKAASAGQFEGANLVIYADHGMSTENTVELDAQTLITDFVGDDLYHTDFPNIYVHDLGKKAEIGEELVKQTAIDLTFIRQTPDLVRGFSRQGAFEIEKKDNLYRYSFAEQDFFGYDEVGYQSEFLSKEQWLSLTKEHLYPAMPPNMFSFMENPNAGHIVYVLIPPRIPMGSMTMQGNHSSLVSDDMLVPLLFKGPAFENLESIDEFWLHEAFTKHLPMIDFKAKKNREQHSIQLSYPSKLKLALSPISGLRGGLTLENKTVEPWLECSLYHSFFSRLWLGAFISEQKPHLKVRLELFVGDWSLEWLKGTDDRSSLSLHWQMVDQCELFIARDQAGLRLFF